MKALPRDGVHPGKPLTPQVALSLLFFVSGGVALMYQMVWQRVLFAAFGINTESVTIIVSVFMFGLGIGALCGAVVQRWYPPLAVPLFCAIELGIGVFGLVSISAIQHLAASVEAVDLWRLTGYVYLLLGLPTVLMGATLPILVGYLDRRFPQRKNDQHFWVFQRSSRVLEDYREIPQPRNDLARLVESSFPQDRVVAALVEVHDEPFRRDFDHSTRFHVFAVQLIW